MPIASDKRITATVDLMANEWEEIVEKTGDLTYRDMERTLRYAKEHGVDVVQAKKESTLEKMNHYFIGETQLVHGTLD